MASVVKDSCQSSQPIPQVKANAQEINVVLNLAAIAVEGARQITKLAKRPQEIRASGSSAKESKTKGASKPTIKPPAAPPMDKQR